MQELILIVGFVIELSFDRSIEREIFFNRFEDEAARCNSLHSLFYFIFFPSDQKIVYFINFIFEKFNKKIKRKYIF